MDRERAWKSSRVRDVLLGGSLEKRGHVTAVGAPHDPPPRVDSGMEESGFDLFDIRVTTKSCRLHGFDVLSGV